MRIIDVVSIKWNNICTKQNPNKLPLLKNLTCWYTSQISRDVRWALRPHRGHAMWRCQTLQRCTQGHRWPGAGQRGRSHWAWGTSLDSGATSKGALHPEERKSPEFKLVFEGFLSLLVHLRVKELACPTWNPHSTSYYLRNLAQVPRVFNAFVSKAVIWRCDKTCFTTWLWGLDEIGNVTHLSLAHCHKGITQEMLAIKGTVKSTFLEEGTVWTKRGMCRTIKGASCVLVWLTHSVC